ncbi:MAG: hypothetical protein ANABAC_1288 [Anaerolineae bacterium]|nr:MAG: hypothetical protein ANABAC_1288 [Anaerolineae bacterium]
MLYSLLTRFLKDKKAELDEKALLIALFVLAAVVSLSPLGQKIAQTFSSISSQL